MQGTLELIITLAILYILLLIMKNMKIDNVQLTKNKGC